MSQSSNQPQYYPDLKVDRLTITQSSTKDDDAIRNVFDDIQLTSSLSGVRIKVCKSGVRIKLPPTSIAYTYEIVNACPADGNFIISPVSSDVIVGGGFADGKPGQEIAIRNGKPSSSITLVGDGTEGWVITKICARPTFAFI